MAKGQLAKKRRRQMPPEPSPARRKRAFLLRPPKASSHISLNQELLLLNYNAILEGGLKLKAKASCSTKHISRAYRCTTACAAPPRHLFPMRERYHMMAGGALRRYESTLLVVSTPLLQ